MAESKFSWTVVATKLLISEYEAHEMLYASEHKNYKNRNKRLDVYKKIAETISRECTVNDVKKKINGLRSQYLAEKMKINRSLRSGADTNNIYKPTVYWFPLLKFLDKSTEADDSTSNLDHPQESENEATLPDDESQNLEESETLNAVENVTPLSRKNTEMVEAATQSPKRKKKKGVSYDALLSQATNTMTEMTNLCREVSAPPKLTTDSLDSFGQFIVTELRGIKDASNDVILRRTKRKLQQVIMETWDRIDQPTMLSTPSSSQHSSNWSATPQYIPNYSPNDQSHAVQNDTNEFGNIVSSALIYANITNDDYIEEN